MAFLDVQTVSEKYLVQKVYLLQKDARSYSFEHTADPWFQSITSRTSNELTIKNGALSDSTLYYCAL